MKPFGRGLGLMLLDYLCKASDTQIDPALQRKCVEFSEQKTFTDAQLYDFVAEIAATPIDRISPKVAIGEISSFVQAACDVKRYYTRPEDGVTTECDYKSQFH
jgi:hypothetical protein